MLSHIWGQTDQLTDQLLELLEWLFATKNHLGCNISLSAGCASSLLTTPGKFSTLSWMEEFCGNIDTNYNNLNN